MLVTTASSAGRIRTPIPIEQEAGWAAVLDKIKYRAVLGIRAQHHPARSQSLYRLSYPELNYLFLSTLVP